MDYLIMATDDKGNKQAVGLTDTGNTTPTGQKIYKLVTDTSVTINNVTLGAVKIQDAVAATQAEVKASTGIATGDNALATHDPAIGQIGDTQGNGTVIGLLSELVPATNVGVSGHNVVSADASAAPIAVTDAPTAGQHVEIHALVVSSDATNITVIFTEETSGTELLRFYMNANTQNSPAGFHVKLPTINKRLMVQTSKAGNIAVTALWHSVP